MNSQFFRGRENVRGANYDALTGLANRRFFDERLDHAMARTGQSTVFAVIVFDLNEFKPINDTYGHAAGDKILQEVAGRTLKALRNGDTTARLGGDEFVVLLENLPDDGVAALASIERRIVDSICSQHYFVEDQSIGIGLSIGAALYPSMATSRSNLLRIADEKMYRMKRETEPPRGRHLRSVQN